MFVSIAEYRVKAEFAERNLENIKAYLPDVFGRLQPRSVYSVSVSQDGRSFVHVFIHETEGEADILGEIAGFRHFLEDVMKGCEDAPRLRTFREV